MQEQELQGPSPFVSYLKDSQVDSDNDTNAKEKNCIASVQQIV